jgi:hypothetical protein
MKELSEAGKEELALALLLLRDFKSDGKMDIGVTKMVLELCEHCGVTKQYEKLMPLVPPMKITPR